MVVGVLARTSQLPAGLTVARLRPASRVPDPAVNNVSHEPQAANLGGAIRDRGLLHDASPGRGLVSRWSGQR